MDAAKKRGRYIQAEITQPAKVLHGDGAPPAEAPAKGRQVRGGKGSAPRKPAKQKITVFKTSRGKKKFTTSVVGLSTFGIELKVASKVFGQKFATGSSVTGNGDEIVIQGDVKDEIIDLLTEKWPEVCAKRAHLDWILRSKTQIRRTYQNRLLERLPISPLSDVNGYWRPVQSSTLCLKFCLRYFLASLI
ncbi:density-regulated protein [Clonorchis sinensis]|uniref:Density-regulated protein n=1 Tax=Clonorchis sinensis TaxID=79923 RepID=G7YLH0_CLOSI|nr:density-regulated protein [Clonorchis sinensis]